MIEARAAGCRRASSSALTDLIRRCRLSRRHSCSRPLARLLLRPALWVVGLLAGGLGTRVPFVSVEAFPFGSALVSTVGTFGLESVHAPVLPFARVGLVIVVGAVAWRPRVVEDDVVPRRTVELNLTLDHRLLDGAQASVFADVLTAAVGRPADHFDEPGAVEPEPVDS